MKQYFVIVKYPHQIIVTRRYMVCLIISNIRWNTPNQSIIRHDYWLLPKKGGKGLISCHSFYHSNYGFSGYYYPISNYKMRWLCLTWYNEQFMDKTDIFAKLSPSRLIYSAKLSLALSLISSTFPLPSPTPDVEIVGQPVSQADKMIIAGRNYLTRITHFFREFKLCGKFSALLF